ncbi:MAG: CBS domain-containing protein [Candidatus Bathyarchaeia archaeon]
MENPEACFTSRFIEDLRNQPVEAFISSLVELPSTSNLSKVMGLLTARGVYEVFLPEGFRCGIVSARDVLRAGNFEAAKADVLMTYVPMLSKSTTVREAARIMADYRIRALPVSDGKALVGQLNSASLLNQLGGKIGEEMRMTSLATKSPITLDGSSPVAKARDLMIQKRIDHLPIIRDQRVAGVVTSTDVISRIVRHQERLGGKSMEPEMRRSLSFPVDEITDPIPLTCLPETSADHALEIMLKGGKSCVLVTHWDELQGIATHRDFMKLLVEAEPEPEIPIFMVGLPDNPFEAEAATAKFKRAITQLNLILPDMLEARSIVKTKFTKPEKERGRYEVTVHIKTPQDTYTYTEGGWELPAIYDILADRLKRLLSRKTGQRRKRETERRGPT